MPATAARIRFSVREFEFASALDAAVLANRPDAIDGYGRVIESFFDDKSNAQTVLNERFTFMKSLRRHEAAEVEGLLSIGSSIAIMPTVPKVRLIDPERNLDATLYLKGQAIDMNTDRNSIEADG